MFKKKKIAFRSQKGNSENHHCLFIGGVNIFFINNNFEKILLTAGGDG